MSKKSNISTMVEQYPRLGEIKKELEGAQRGRTHHFERGDFSLFNKPLPLLFDDTTVSLTGFCLTDKWQQKYFEAYLQDGTINDWDSVKEGQVRFVLTAHTTHSSRDPEAYLNKVSVQFHETTTLSRVLQKILRSFPILPYFPIVQGQSGKHQDGFWSPGFGSPIIVTEHCFVAEHPERHPNQQWLIKPESLSRWRQAKAHVRIFLLPPEDIEHDKFYKHFTDWSGNGLPQFIDGDHDYEPWD